MSAFVAGPARAAHEHDSVSTAILVPECVKKSGRLSLWRLDTQELPQRKTVTPR